MGVNPASTAYWLHVLGQEHSEECSAAVDGADEWCLKESKGRRQQVRKAELEKLKKQTNNSSHPCFSLNINFFFSFLGLDFPCPLMW